MKKIELPPRGIETLFGVHDQNIKFLESLLDVQIDARGNELTINGEESNIQTVELILRDFAELFAEGKSFTDKELRDAFKQTADDNAFTLRDYFTVARFNPSGKKQVAPKTANQRKYVEAIAKNDLTFGIGPAGTGKSFLAVAMAVQSLFKKEVSRIILTRPAVEAGEKLGFLPGDLQDKVDPYLRPLYDALFDLVDAERVTKMLEKRIIEVAPLAFMRGRAQTLDSKILTPDGWRKMGDLQNGDFVVGSDGKPTEVIGVFPQGKKEVFRVTMTDGASAVVCGEHLWQVKTMEDKRRNKPARVLETQEMIGNFRRNNQYCYELPLLSAPVEWEPRQILLDAYSLGLLLGDGCITDKTSPGFATKDYELISSLETGFSKMDLKIRRKSKIDFVITNPFAGKGGHFSQVVRNPLTQILRELNLSRTRSNTKFVPEIYLYNDANVRLAVLQGLLDTDGGVVTQANRTCRIQYATTSERLRDDVIFLVRSLGGVATSRTRKASGRKPGFARGREVEHRNDAFILEIRLPENIEPFRLRRKADVYQQLGAGRPMRFIKNIEKVGEAETQCISVAALDSLYVTDDFILTHNTLADAFIILDEAQNTTSEQMKMFLTRIGFGSKTVVTGDITQIDLPRGQRSGLKEAQEVLKDIDTIGFIRFDDRDVVRHKLVQQIVRAYDAYTKKFDDERNERNPNFDKNDLRKNDERR
ncbi:MAG: PhoH family protein [Pyrinomonadaceae bacterium]|nr:PhoH family protein [Pyrinomonadaceae bacterium]